MPRPLSQARALLLVFLAAVAVRWTYALALFLVSGNGGLMVADSYGYLSMAGRFASSALSGAPMGWDWLGLDISVMPLITWLWALSVIVFGKFGALGFVLLQGIADAGTCLCIYGTARCIRTEYALPAGLAAAFNPTQVVLAGLFYTDTFFLFFCALVLFAMARWMQSPSLRPALMAGIAVGCAAMTRILIVPWAVCALGLLLVVALLRKQPLGKCVRELGLAAAVAALLVSPVVARNVIQYGSWSLTAQTGAYYAFWIAPLVKQASDGTPWEKGAEEMRAREARSPAAQSDNPFAQSRRLAEIGRDAVREMGTAAIVKAWAFGAALNLASPAIMLSPPVIGLPRTGFYATPGDTPVRKVVNFLFRSDNALYAWIVLIGIVGLVAVRLIQLVGVAAILRRPEHFPMALLLGSWLVYVLLVNGPIASPKYRLPIEPPLMVLSGAGFYALRDWRLKRRARTAQPA